MRHLREEEFIDVLMGEPHDAALEAHLEACSECAENMNLLRSGLDVAHAGEPKVPLMALPPITYTGFQRRQKTFRMTWLAAAAILLMGLMGLRVEVGDGSMTFELAFFKGGDRVAEERIEALETNLMIAMDAIEAQSVMTQEQIDARFNQVYFEQNREYRDLQAFMARYNENVDLANEKHFIDIKDQLIEEVRKQGFKGSLQ